MSRLQYGKKYMICLICAAVMFAALTAVYVYAGVSKKTVSIEIYGEVKQVTFYGNKTTAEALEIASVSLTVSDMVNFAHDRVLGEGDVVVVSRKAEESAAAVSADMNDIFASCVPEYVGQIKKGISRIKSTEKSKAVNADLKASEVKASSPEQKSDASAVTVSGKSYKYSKKIMITATAYCACSKCCGIYADGYTADGSKATQYHTIAAPQSYKFGTKVYMPYFKDKPNSGIFEVEDRGGAITGDKIDIYYDSHQEALKFGVRQIEMYVLK